MRRLQASIKTDDSPSLGMRLAPLEAQIKSLQKEVGALPTPPGVGLRQTLWSDELIATGVACQVAKLSEDNKAQERNLKAKEAGLVKAEEKVEAAVTKVKQMEGLVNKTVELGRQVEAKEVLAECLGSLPSLHTSTCVLVYLFAGGDKGGGQDAPPDSGGGEGGHGPDHDATRSAHSDRRGGQHHQGLPTASDGEAGRERKRLFCFVFFFPLSFMFHFSFFTSFFRCFSFSILKLSFLSLGDF